MNRAEQLQELRSTPEYDVVIIGGGATGLGCAVDAASRGLKTLLLEKHDFAKGTSSRATKLVHGGVRYLAQGNLRLVREALYERGRLLQNAPHICDTLAFVVPAYKWWQKYYYGFGLAFYEFLSFKLSLGKTKRLSAAQTLQHLPSLNSSGLSGGVLYYDGQFNDSRLAINLAQTAVDQGAAVVNYCGVTGFEKVDGKIVGVHATDELNGQSITIKAKVVINATGVFGDSVLKMDNAAAAQTIAPSQGVHLVVDRHFFGGDTALMIPKTDDGRVLFIIPWQGKWLLGTTDTPVDDVTAEPRALPEEIDFIISHFNRYASATVSRADVRSVFVGLRPLAKMSDEKKTSVMPRDHVIKVLPSGLVHVTGGKWTTYRSMAEHTIDAAVGTGELPEVKDCQTKELVIRGGEKSEVGADRSSVESTAERFGSLDQYGSDAARIRQLVEQDSRLAEKLHPDHPFLLAEVRWCIDQEMACTVEDVLARRIRLLFLDARAAITVAPAVAKLLAEQLGHDSNWATSQVETFTELADGYLLTT